MTDFRELSISRRCWSVFFAFFRISMVVIGGGYAIIAAAQLEFVEKRHWLTDDDVVEMITITQTVPGILACNSSIYMGWRIAGIAGAVAGLLGAAIPSVVIIILIAAGMKSIEHLLLTPAVQGMFRGLIAAITGMVIVTALRLRKKTVQDVFGWAVAAGCFIGMTLLKINPVLLIAGAILFGLVKVWREKRKATEK